MKRRGIHTKPNVGTSVEWITPREIVEALGKFDLDPCAHPRQFYRTAGQMIHPPADGLTAAWNGRVWLNPPYGSEAVGRWLQRLVKHGDGIALVPARTEVEKWLFPFVWDAATAVLFRRGRIYFHRPDGSLQGNAGHGSVLVAYGSVNAAALLNSGIVGKFIYLR